MAARNAILLRPQWVVANAVTMPLVTYGKNDKKSVRGLIEVIIPFTIFLDTLFDEARRVNNGRSLGDDQFHVFKSIEGALQATGVDGKACLLRTICEMQKNPIAKFSMMGKIVTILLTPKRGVASFLHEYLEAEHIGQSINMTCAAEFPTCPVSLFKLFKLYNLEGDKPILGEGQYSEGDNLHDKTRTVSKMSLDNEIHYHPTTQPFEIDNTIDTAKQ